MVRIIIAGRTGTGKTTLMRKIQARYGILPLKTYTDRPRRDGESPDAYHFITKEQMADRLEYSGTELPVLLGDYHYCTTRTDMIRASLMILEPSGVYRMLELFPDDHFILIYTAADKKDILPKIRNRNLGDENTAVQAYNIRAEKEDGTFREFEADMIGLQKRKNVTIMWPNPFPADQYESFLEFLDVIYRHMMQENAVSCEKEVLGGNEQSDMLEKTGALFHLEFKYKMMRRPPNVPEYIKVSMETTHLPDTPRISQIGREICMKKGGHTACCFAGFTKIELIRHNWKNTPEETWKEVE